MKMKMGLANLEEITEERKYQDIALLIDREDFQKNLVTLKKKHRKVPEYIKKSQLGSTLMKALPKEHRIAQELIFLYRYPQSFFWPISKV